MGDPSVDEEHRGRRISGRVVFVLGSPWAGVDQWRKLDFVLQKLSGWMKDGDGVMAAALSWIADPPRWVPCALILLGIGLYLWPSRSGIDRRRLPVPPGLPKSPNSPDG